ILSPLYVLFRNARWLNPGNVVRVLIGHCTWIGYIEPEASNTKYPKLRKGIFTVADGLDKKGYQAYLGDRINFQYAKDYTVGWDFRVLRRVVMGG
ncbi:MAG: hypothetical protein KDC24_12615, partial [Saprospiraceae bacterium]|nr:hypothetical protein [Saprospiraceae bacterium]